MIPENKTEIETSIKNGNFKQAKTQFNNLELSEKESLINYAFEQQDKNLLKLCKLLLIDKI